MLFTIAIPTFNNEKTIARAINSALDQDYKEDYEILIANNASKDGTLGIIKSFKDDKIRIIENKETCDMYTNHNICLNESKGNYVIFCHSDDELLPNALTILSTKIRERNYPERYIIWGHSLFRDFYPVLLRSKLQVNTMFSGEIAINCFSYGGGISPSGTCYSRKALIEIGGFPTSSIKAPAMDWGVLVLSAFRCFEFEMLDRLYFKRTDASTAVKEMTKKDRVDILKDALGILFPKITVEQRNRLINQMASYPNPVTLGLLKNLISKKAYFKGYVRMKMVNLFNF